MVAVSWSGLRATYLACLYLGLAAFAAESALSVGSGDDSSYYELVIAGVLALLASHVSWAMLLYRCWRCVEVRGPLLTRQRTALDPGVAVALTVIPGINMVGAFFGLGPLPGHVNRLARAVGLRQRAHESLGHFAAGFMACQAIPVVGILLALVAVSVLVPVLIVRCSSVCEAVEAAVAAGKEPVPPGTPSARA